VIQIDSLGGPVPILPGPAAPVIRIVIETEADYVELWADKCLELDMLCIFEIQFLIGARFQALSAV